MMAAEDYIALLEVRTSALQRRIRALEAREHRVRCDLIDALFYVELVSGTHGPGITDAERKRASEFHNRITERYPMQKGKHLGMEQLETFAWATRPCHNCGSSSRSTACHICGFPIDDPTEQETKGDAK